MSGRAWRGLSTPEYQKLFTSGVLTHFTKRESYSPMRKRARFDVSTVAELIKAFGGPTALGRFLDVGPSAIANWEARKLVPPGWHLRLHLEAERRGISIDPSLFNLTDEGAVDPPRRATRPRSAATAA